MRDTEFSILVFVSGFWSRYTHRVLDALDILKGGTVSVSITYVAVTTLAASIGGIGAYRGLMRLGCKSRRSGSRRTPWEHSG